MNMTVEIQQVELRECTGGLQMGRRIWLHMCTNIVFRQELSAGAVLGGIVPTENKHKCAI